MKMNKKAAKIAAYNLERETRFELATPTLARLCSTTELFPLEGTAILRGGADLSSLRLLFLYCLREPGWSSADRLGQAARRYRTIDHRVRPAAT